MAQDTTSIAHFDATYNIKEFLQRPVRIWHSHMGATDVKYLNEFAEKGAPQTPIATWELPGAVLNQGGKLEKVKNHQYFKADVKMKLVLNTSPFVAARFYLTYSPYEKVISESRQQQWASRAGVTAYPGVEIDAQLDNSVEITIPFASFRESYVLTNKDSDFVTVNLYGLTKLNAKEGAKIDMAMYAWFDNIELNIPTLKNPSGYDKAREVIHYVPRPFTQRQNEKIDIGTKVLHLKSSSNPSDKAIFEYIKRTLGLMQIDGKERFQRAAGKIVKTVKVLGTMRVKGCMQVQAENAQSGPIGSIAGTVSGIAGAIGNAVPIPIVNEIASGVSWIADIVGGIANIFGWSKPNSYKQVCPLQNVPGKFYTHFDSEDQSVSLSLTAKNELDKLNNIFPSAADEMDLSYVCANPALKYVLNWPSTAKAGETFVNDPIGLLPVGIGSFNATELASATGFSEADEFTVDQILGCPQDTCAPKDGFIPYTAYKKWGNADNITRPTIRAQGKSERFILSTAPCEFVAQLFKYWRATICFKISAVKTAFHTGRIEIFFDPGMYNTKTPLGKYVEPDLHSYLDLDTSNNYKYILDLTNDSEVTIKIPFVSEKLFLSTKGLNGGYSVPSVQQVMDSIIGALVIRPVTNLMCPETVADNIDILVWKWAEDVVFTCPVNSGGNNLAIYDKDAPSDLAGVHIRDIPKEVVKKLPVDGVAMTCTSDALSVDEFREKEREMRVKGEIQINISNKADGNVIVFFKTTNIEEENMNACKNASGERLVSLRPLLRIFRLYDTDTTLDKTINIQNDDRKADPDYISYLSYMYRFFRGGFRFKVMSDGDKVTSSLVESEGDSGKLTPSHVSFPALNPVHEVSMPFYSQYRKLPISSKEASIMQLRLVGKNVTQAEILRSGNDDLTYGWLMGTPQLLAGSSGITWEGLNVVSYKGALDQLHCDSLLKRIPQSN